MIDKSEYEKQKGNKGRQKAFQGQAYRLGDTEGQSEVVGASGSDNTTREIDTVLTFWSNGFTVNHGPLRLVFKKAYSSCLLLHLYLLFSIFKSVF